ncbi:amidohydrolase family protein [Nitrospinota bacterium]
MKRAPCSITRCYLALCLGALLMALWAGPAAAARIPIIDAHSQVDHEVDLEDVIKLMNKGGVSRTILSVRMNVSPKKLAAFADRHPGRITPGLRTKIWAYVRNEPKYYRMLKMQLRLPQFGALAEVILCHAQKGDVAPEWIVHPDQPQVQEALKIALEKGWPFIAHIEFAAAQFDRDMWMKKFEALAAAHPKHPFPLIHMGQLHADDAARLIGAHPNVYFMTSHSNSVSVGAARGQPWMNLFKGWRLAPKWKKLIVRHPDRFILAFDNVFADHWGDFYLDQIDLWRKALAELPPAAAHALAHRNAERLWRFPPAKPVRTK